MSQRNIDFGDDKDFGRTPDLNADAPGRRRGGEARLQVLRGQGRGHRLQGPAGARSTSSPSAARSFPAASAATAPATSAR